MRDPPPDVPLGTIAREWTRIGVTGFGGPPTHIALLRRLVVGRGWIGETDFEGAIAACNLLPGPASTQLSIYCARRLGGAAGAWIGGLAFIVPAVAMVTALSAVFLAGSPPRVVRGAGAGAGAAVAAVAVQAGLLLLGPSYARVRASRSRRLRWCLYALLGVTAAALAGRFLVLVLIACGAAEVYLRARPEPSLSSFGGVAFIALAATGGLGALVWVAFKVGALSYGGGFVIVPLMRGDAVNTYHWMTAGQFLNAVALGQVTPGPVVATVAAVGYAAHGVGGAVLAAVIAFAPSFCIVLLGGSHFERLSGDPRMQAFLAGAGPAAIGAILGSAIPLAGSLREAWQFAVLAGAAVLLLVVRRGPVLGLLCAAGVGAVVALAGGPLP